MTTYDYREAKQPRWVQDELRRLRQGLAAAEKRIAILTQELPTETDTVVRDYVRGNIPLPPRAVVHFLLNDHDIIEAYIDTDAEGDRHLSVRSTGSASGSLVLRPRSSNAVRITAAR